MKNMVTKSSGPINRIFIKGLLLITCFLLFNYSTGFAEKYRALKYSRIKSFKEMPAISKSLTSQILRMLL